MIYVIMNKTHTFKYLFIITNATVVQLKAVVALSQHYTAELHNMVFWYLFSVLDRLVFEVALTRGDVDAGYGDGCLLQDVDDGAKGVPHSPLEAEAKDGVYDHVVHLIDNFSL